MKGATRGWSRRWLPRAMAVVLALGACTAAEPQPLRVAVEARISGPAAALLRVRVTQPEVLLPGERSGHELMIRNVGASKVDLGDPRFNMRDGDLLVADPSSGWVIDSQGELVSGGDADLRVVIVEPGAELTFVVEVLSQAGDVVLQPGRYEVSQEIPDGAIDLRYVVAPAPAP